MAAFKRFEDIKAWQKAREATRENYRQALKTTFARDFGLRDQIQRSAVSAMANTATGFGRHSDRAFANFLNVAHASISESQSHLYAAFDLGYIDQNSFRKLYEMFDEVSRMTMALAKHLRTPRG